ncbi:CCA tRNA nucleotidyltransferase [Clostridium botulinum]|uniref:CCA tRNA nucleotidyltransferase n=1 Tax=Clostridium botulinum TaxID=1491 RepID=A0A6B4JM11_CLOBO|nr:CCA tRNA nucleotidyltransferase [Clostridium botulinum]EES47973.1 tRNA nucleotidyltransferase/poly(A) polymerase family protein [Clostridium botulinum E1 str. 'BoNT E Beluga']MBY6761183.1 CCA tRNA nucleotidyltransferase [Clostridium botulinum]MBY6921339.1 CCA tRNA nucleotidyltransferase [Clostridium botulinum]MCR1132098.1 CCA tRNA nucleotidyltransferase [Clostridium botulinum]NFH70827.1 CCA tRNA nucleotidyltransferase [Clostridium botulinum]
MNFNINIPNDVRFILETLKNNGHEAYIVGGCVRDSILNNIPKDWDITTKARPEEVVKLFNKVILTGVKHGTVTVLINSEGYEVTTYRMDGKYEDSRHPKQVKFVSNLKEDLARRDFTINAMAYNKEDGLIDYFEGVSDLKKKVIKTVGNSEKRFSEDALRMLRAIRFSSQLDFSISNETLNSIKNLRYNIKNISKERIREEFNKILFSSTKGIDILIETGLIEHIFPEIIKFCDFKADNMYYNDNLYAHTVRAIEEIESSLHLKLTMLFYNLIKINNEDIEYTILQVKEFLKEFKYDNNTVNKVTTLILYMNNDLNTKLEIKQILNLINLDLFEDLLKVKEAEILSQNPLYKEERLSHLLSIRENLKEILLNKECFNLKDLSINGKDLINLGLEKGKNIGEMLNELLELVMNNPDLNDKEILIDIVKEKINL